MHTRFKISMKLASCLGLIVVAACGQESTPAQQPLTLALERPLEVCQERDETCRVSLDLDPVACQESMRKCLESVATWMQESSALIESCREQAALCFLGGPAELFSCNAQFESCVAPTFQPDAPSDQDASVPDEDAGVTTTPPSVPTTEGAAGSTSAPPIAGSGGSGTPSVPPTLPGSFGAADACRSQLLECLTPSADLFSCAVHTRECLRSSLLPIP